MQQRRDLALDCEQMASIKALTMIVRHASRALSLTSSLLKSVRHALICKSSLMVRAGAAVDTCGARAWRLARHRASFVPCFRGCRRARRTRCATAGVAAAATLATPTAISFSRSRRAAARARAQCADSVYTCNVGGVCHVGGVCTHAILKSVSRVRASSHAVRPAHAPARPRRARAAPAPAQAAATGPARAVTSPRRTRGMLYTYVALA